MVQNIHMFFYSTPIRKRLDFHNTMGSKHFIKTSKLIFSTYVNMLVWIFVSSKSSSLFSCSESLLVKRQTRMKLNSIKRIKPYKKSIRVYISLNWNALKPRRCGDVFTNWQKNKGIDLNRFFIWNSSKEPIRGNESVFYQHSLIWKWKRIAGGVFAVLFWFNWTFAFPISHSGLLCYCGYFSQREL